MPGANALLAAQPPAAPIACGGSLACDTDLGPALDLERKIADNTWDGQVYEVDYDTLSPERTRADIVSVNHFGDSALWTGTYLAAQSFRYALAQHKLAARPQDPERKLWKDQRDESLARVLDMARKFHILANISQLWNHELNPSLEQPGFGGGVFAGEPGYLMRACIPKGVPAWQTWSELSLQTTDVEPPPYTRNRRVFGPFPWRNEDGTTTEYYCEDGTSRDAYAGTIFGLLAAFDLVGRDQPQMRHRIRDDIVTLVNFAVKYYWNTPRPHGRISLPIPTGPGGVPCSLLPASPCGHDFENFVSPLFVLQPIHRMNMAQAARHVVHADPGRDDAAKWDEIWTVELLTDLPFLDVEYEVDAVQPNESYYKFNLLHLTSYDVIHLEEDPLTRSVFKQAFGVLDRTTGDDVNAHFETITYALSGERSRLDAAIAHLRQWRDYRARVDTVTSTTNSTRCGTSLECVPEDQLEIIQPTPLGEETIVVPGTSTDLRARRPLPVAQRAETDFLWQRPPTQLDGGESLTHQFPGIDYLLPYWMLRYYTEAAPPPVEPIPAWPGPAHA